MHGHSENEEFAQLIDALNPWLEEVVIIGGWAHRLYRIHPVAQAIAYVPIGTLTRMSPFPLDYELKAMTCESGWSPMGSKRNG